MFYNSALAPDSKTTATIAKTLVPINKIVSQLMYMFITRIKILGILFKNIIFILDTRKQSQTDEIY